MAEESKKWCLARPIEGISLNGDEYLLDDEGKVRVWDTPEEPIEFMNSQSEEKLSSDEWFDNYGIYAKEYKEEYESETA